MDNINLQLEEKEILLKKGAIVDASITDSPRKPRGKKEYQVIEDRKEPLGVHGQEQGPTAPTTILPTGCKSTKACGYTGCMDQESGQIAFWL